MLTTWLEFENLKPEGRVQHMSGEMASGRDEGVKGYWGMA